MNLMKKITFTCVLLLFSQAFAGSPPSATILTPLPGAKFNAGTLVSFSGTATDPETGELPASAFTWRVEHIRGENVQETMAPTTGILNGSFFTDNQNDPSFDAFYRIILTVTDAEGLSNTVIRDIFANTVVLTVTSNVPGLTVFLDGQLRTSPALSESAVGFIRTIGTNSQQTLNGRNYEFISWSDGGIRDHAITTPNTNRTYTAIFRDVTSAFPVDTEIEAEDGFYTSPLRLIPSQEAFGGAYLAASSGSSVTGSDGFVRIPVNIPKSGEYRIFARVRAPNGESDSFFVSIDDGPEDVFDMAPGSFSTDFRWVKVNGRAGLAPFTLNPRTFTLSSGIHMIKFRGREANSGIDRIYVTDNPFIDSPSPVAPVNCPLGQYKAEYFNNINFSGTPALTRCEASVNQDWGTASPNPSINSDRFSVRWTGISNFSTGSHLFRATTDDGMRIFLDNTPVINSFKDQPATSYQETRFAPAGAHQVKVEYYESTGHAVAKMNFNLVTHTIPIEAEAGTIVAPLTVLNSSLASGGQYVTTTSGSGNLGSDGSVTFTFQVPVSSSYFVWARVLAQNGESDSFFVSIDGVRNEDVFDLSPNGFSNDFQWVRLNGRGTGGAFTINPRILNLAPGNHSLRFRHRETRSGLDRIIITNDPNFRP